MQSLRSNSDNCALQQYKPANCVQPDNFNSLNIGKSKVTIVKLEQPDKSSTGSVMNGGVSHEKSTTGNSLFITTVHYQGGEWFFHDSTALESCVYYLKY